MWRGIIAPPLFRYLYRLVVKHYVVLSVIKPNPAKPVNSDAKAALPPRLPVISH